MDNQEKKEKQYNELIMKISKAENRLADAEELLRQVTEELYKMKNDEKQPSLF
jgi:hypothetical protein